MLLNNLTIAWRTFIRSKRYSLLNLLGLAVGFASFLLIGLFVRHELSVDRFHAKRDSIYKLLKVVNNNGEMGLSQSHNAPLATYLEETVPEVEATFQFFNLRERLVTVEDQYYLEPKVIAGGEDFFGMFDFPVLTKSAEAKGPAKGEVFIAESLAEKYFGNREALGELLEIDKLGAYEITGVYEDLPQNTHFDFELLLSFDAVETHFQRFPFGRDFTLEKWFGIVAFPMYLQLQEGSDPVEVNKKIIAATQTHVEEYDAQLQPLSQVYYDANNTNFKNGGNVTNNYVYLLIGVLILLIASTNFVNLSTARYSKRAKEVGVRKVLGSSRAVLISQFLVESLVMSFLAMVIAVCLVEVCLPSFNAYLDRQLLVDFRSLSTWLIFLSLTLFVGGMAGGYPAFFLSGFKPTRALKGMLTKGKKGGRVREGLIIAQFLIAIGLISITTVVYRQLEYLLDFETGFQEEQLVVVQMPDVNVQQNYSTFKEMLLTNPGISQVTGSNYGILNASISVGFQPEGMVGEEGSLSMSYIEVEEGYVENVGLQVLEGRSFEPGIASDRGANMLINETAKSEIGWEDALGKRMNASGRNRVIGVVEDFLFESVRTKIRPAVIIQSTGNQFGEAMVKISGSNIRETLDHIESTYASFNPRYPIKTRFVDDAVAEMYASERKLGQLFLAFSLLAVFIAVLGLVGLASFTTQQRAKEIGIRKVLGASARGVVLLLNGQVTRLVIVASVIAIPLAIYSIQGWLSDFAYQASFGVIYWIIAPVTVLLFTWLTVSITSFRAASTNPVDILRNE